MTEQKALTDAQVVAQKQETEAAMATLRDAAKEMEACGATVWRVVRPASRGSDSLGSCVATLHGHRRYWRWGQTSRNLGG